MKELEEELQTMLTFVKSSYTNATHQESEWMQVCVKKNQKYFLFYFIRASERGCSSEHSRFLL